ncbi:hypothetical protein POM88_046914 [Heracleum sosnowskyi]|uniref:Uncharacterized protein n=1 Tax=Heracleum sosnowskyi TaxID=360622 RepID=A0AAD8HAD6_9APIA|nr:hypothetical protein POM88_046914 [Heracleum sosnowskyi]
MHCKSSSEVTQVYRLSMLKTFKKWNKQGVVKDLPVHHCVEDNPESKSGRTSVEAQQFNGSSVDQIQSFKLDPDISHLQPKVDAADLGTTRELVQGKCARSRSFTDRSFMKEQEISEEAAGFDDCFYLSNSVQNLKNSVEGRYSPSEEEAIAADHQKFLDISLSSNGVSVSGDKCAQVKQPTSGSFRCF